MLSVLLDTGYLNQTMKKVLVLNREPLDMICALYVDEEQVDKFETVLNTVINIHKIAQLNKK